MNIKIFFFLILIANYANASINELYIIEKDFTETTKVVEKYLKTKDYKVIESNDKIFSIYFDTPELLYLKQNGYIQYEAIAYLSKKKKKVKYKEIIKYSLDSNITETFPVKHYNNVKTLEGKHPLLSMIKRKERKVFLNKLKNDGIKYPMRIKAIVHTSKHIHIFELYDNETKIGTISINKVEASALDNSTDYITLNIKMTDNEIVVNDLKTLLDVTISDTMNNTYTGAYNKMKDNVDLFYAILRYPYLVNLLYALMFGLFGLIIVFILFRKSLNDHDTL